MSEYRRLEITVSEEQYAALAAIGVVQAAQARPDGEPFAARHVASTAVLFGLDELLRLYGLPRADEEPS